MVLELIWGMFQTHSVIKSFSLTQMKKTPKYNDPDLKLENDDNFIFYTSNYFTKEITEAIHQFN